MAKPVILAVDDEIQVLNAVERDLLSHYRRDYRVLKASSGSEALELVKKLKQRNSPLALFLIDQRMPGVTGIEFLTEARKYYPNARQVLLTAYADTEVAIASINTIGLDYYLMKPWDPPEQNLYPILDEILDEWLLTARLPYDGIRLAGTLWSARSHTTKDFLARNRIAYQWLDVEKDPEARLLVESVNNGQAELPVVFFPDGTILSAPDNRTLAEKIGIRTKAAEKHYDLIIIGGGPAGLGAAVYGASEGLRTLMIERHATGGQAGTSSRIENYLGFPKGISGSDLARRATDQAIRLGCEVLTAREVTKVRVEGNYKIVTLDDGMELSCLALIIATGVTLRQLDVPGVKELQGAGIYYGAALTEAVHYKGEHVFVIGGANSAGQGAIWLAQFAKQVAILIRGSGLVEMSRYLINQIEATPNIDVRTRSVVVGAEGKTRLEQIEIQNIDTQKIETMDAAAMFIFIGAVAHTDMVAGLVERNPQGFILTGPDLFMDGKRPKGWLLPRDPYLLETSVPGIFAAGDIRHAAIRRVASAVGQGAHAVSLVHQYLKTV
ncbi:MAG TPA: FAD-dependent oxidoreductase [Anaerolineales bacterium]|nr:FAD-dependent oxidoreductase [Anaerolineales bacterium]